MTSDQGSITLHPVHRRGCLENLVLSIACGFIRRAKVFRRSPNSGHWSLVTRHWITMTYDNAGEQQGWAAYRVGQGILIEDGKVLLSGNRWYSNKPLAWTLPGGRAEDSEGVIEAVVREWREETGLEVEVLDLAYVSEFRSVLNKRLFLACAFIVRRISGS